MCRLALGRKFEVSLHSASYIVSSRSESGELVIVRSTSLSAHFPLTATGVVFRWMSITSRRLKYKHRFAEHHEVYIHDCGQHFR